MLKAAKSYEEACRTFRWRIPERYNLAFDLCDRQTMAGADGHRTALIAENAAGQAERFTFHVLRLLSNRLANVLAGLGVVMGERVLVSLEPGVEAAISLLAVLKLGAVMVPVSPRLGEQPLAWRLADSGAVAAIVGGAVLPRLRVARQGSDALQAVLAVAGAGPGEGDFWQSLEGASDTASPLVTGAEDPAFLIYPNQASGKPWGILHAHRVLLGNLPPFEFALGFFPHFGDIFWTAADWMGFEGLILGLMPAWHHGVPVVAGPLGHDPEQQLALMGRHGVRAFYAPAQTMGALILAAGKYPHPIPRAIACGAGGLDPALRDLAEKVFGTRPNEIWHGIETGAAAANLSSLMEVRDGSPGRATPGVSVDAVDGVGRVLRAEEKGRLAVSPGAPGAMLARWNDNDPRWGRMESGWLPSGDWGRRDLDGYLWPEPAPLPDGWVMVDGQPVCLSDLTLCLLSHPKVDQAQLVLGADGLLKATLVPVAGETGDYSLGREIQDYVAARRAAWEMPVRIAFRASLAASGEETPIRLDAPTRDDRW